MGEHLYRVLVSGHVSAENMTLDYALIFVNAVFEKWWSDETLKVQIERMPND